MIVEKVNKSKKLREIIEQHMKHDHGKAVKLKALLTDGVQ